MSHEGIDRIDEFFEERDGLDKAIVIAIVATLLIAAVTALGQIRALKRHDVAVSQADQWVAAASQASFRTDAMAQLQLDRFYLTRDARIHAEEARADALLGVGPPHRDSTDSWNQWGLVASHLRNDSAGLTGVGARDPQGIAGEVDASEQLTADTAPDISAGQLTGLRAKCPGATATWPVQSVPTRIPDTGPESAQLDPNFPSRYLADHRRNVFYLEARGTLASKHAEGEEKQFIRFGVALTLFATAVFLFGFAISPYGRLHRPLYATGALLFVVGSSAWAIYAALNPPVSEHPSAAAAYADGVVASSRGADRADTEAAASFFKCAVRFDSTFASAYTNRAMALNNMFDPSDPTGGSNTELVPSSFRTQALADLESADQNGATDPMLPLVKGSDMFEAGLQKSSNETLEQGLQQEQAAAKLVSGSSTESQLVSTADPASESNVDTRKTQVAKLLATSTFIAFNIAEAQLALGNLGAADRAYRTAVSLAARQDNSADIDGQFYASGALTDLVDVANRTTAPRFRTIHAHVVAEKNYVVSQLFNEKGPARHVKVLHTVVLPALAGFAINRPAAFAINNTINAQWYYESPEAGVWSAFSSGPSGEQAPPNKSLNNLFTTPYAATTTCLRSGKYMLEVYVNGQLANQPAPINVKLPQLDPARLQDMDISICRPASAGQQWQPLADGSPRPGAPTRIGGLVDGYISPDHRAGMLVFDVSPEADKQREGRGTGALLDEVLAQFHSWLPGTPEGEMPFQFPFLGGSLGSQTRLYAYSGGLISAGIGATNSGRVIVAVVYGPQSMFIRGTPPLAADLLGSVVSDG
jgi:hypothetical protein